MNHHRTDRTITSIIGQAEGLTTKLPAARDILRQRIIAIDGYPAGTDAPKVTATTELTTVERAANQRIRLEADLRLLTDELDAAALVLSNLHHDCDRILGHQPRPRCDGGIGRQGHMIPRDEGGWSDPTCHNIPSEGRRTCDTCRQRFHRWARQHGHPINDDAEWER